MKRKKDKKQEEQKAQQTTSRFYSLLAAADDTFRNMPVNIRLLVQKVSQAMPDLGPRKLRRKGVGTEFFEARDFRNHLDDPRKINAKLTGKTGKPTVIESEAEISQRVYVWRDPSKNMDYASSDDLFTKKAASEIMMLALARHLTKNEEMVGVIDRKGTYRGGKAAEHVARNLVDVRVIADETPLLRTRPPKNSTAVLFSDFLMPPEDLIHSLAHLKQQGLSGYMIMVLDPQEIEFGFKGHVEFRGMKGVLSETFKKAESIKSDYRHKLIEHIENTKALAKAHGFEFILQRTDEPFHLALMSIYGMNTKDYNHKLGHP